MNTLHQLKNIFIIMLFCMNSLLAAELKDTQCVPFGDTPQTELD